MSFNFNKKKKRSMVRMYDNGTTVLIPAAELAPGMVLCAVQGVEDNVWIDASKMKSAPGFRHESLTTEQTEAVKAIMETLREVHHLTLQEWIDGFRKDTHPDCEIGIWMRITCVYVLMTHDRELQLAEKKAILNLARGCSNSTREYVRKVVDTHLLTEQDIEKTITLFYDGLPESK